MNCEHYQVKNTNLEAYGLSITGQVRKANEDSCGFATVPNGELFVVCDGMGGHVGGATASRIAVEQIIQHFQAQLYPNVYQALHDALCRANIQILGAAVADPSLKGMGTTACIVLISGNDAYIAHVGDSRIYLYEAEKKRLFRITKDHSFVQSLVDMGQLDDRDAEHHPRKNVIMKALGTKEELDPEVYSSPVQPAKDDMFLICSDGLAGMVDDNCLEAILSSDQSVEQKVLDLVNNANVPGKGLDNITAQVIKVLESPYPVSNHPDHNPSWRNEPDEGATGAVGDVQSSPQAGEPSKKKKTKLLLAILIPVIVLLLLAGAAVAAYFIWWRGKGGKEDPNQQKQEVVDESTQKVNENKEKTIDFEEQNKTANEQNQKDAINAELEEALKAKAEADKDKEKAQKEVEQAKKEAEKAKAEAKKAKEEAEKAKAEAKKAQKEKEKSKTEANESEKKKQVDEEAAKAQELKNQYESLKVSINKLKEADAWNACYDLGMTGLPKSASAKTELLREAARAQNDSARMNEIERAIKKNSK